MFAGNSRVLFDDCGSKSRNLTVFPKIDVPFPALLLRL